MTEESWLPQLEALYGVYDELEHQHADRAKLPQLKDWHRFLEKHYNQVLIGTPKHEIIQEVNENADD